LRSIGETNNHNPKRNDPTKAVSFLSVIRLQRKDGHRDGRKQANKRQKGLFFFAGGHSTQAKRITTQKSPTEPQTPRNPRKPTPDTRKGHTGQKGGQERPKIAPV
jgi:hypothetical protein